MNKIKNNPYIIILVISIIVFIPLLSNKYYKGHDTDYHIANIISVEKSISKNILPTKISPIIAKDFGYGGGIFYPKLSHYVSGYTYSIIKNFNLTPYTSMKIWHFITIFSSGIFMYKLVNMLFKDKMVSLISSATYMTAPYLLSQIYVRDSFAESFLTIFIPIIFIGLYKLIKNEKKDFYLYFILGYVGSINSHLVCSIYMTIFIIIFLLFNYKKIFTKEKIKMLIMSSIIILMITSPFLVPLIEHKLNSNYVVFDTGSMYTLELIKLKSLGILDYFKINFGGIFHNIIPVTIIMFIASIFTYKNNKIINGILAFTLISLFMTTKYFPWSKMPDFLLNIQFPWRLEMFTFFGISIISGLVLLKFNQKNKTKLLIIYIIFLLIESSIIIYSIPLYKENYKNLNVSKQGIGWNNEYFPSNTFKNYDYYLNRNNEIKSLDKLTKIKNIKNKTPYLKFDIKVKTKTKLEIPRLYYLGYEIKLNNKKINYKENKNGFIEIEVNSGLVEVKYKYTLANKIAFIISFIGLIFLVKIIKKTK